MGISLIIDALVVLRLRRVVFGSLGEQTGKPNTKYRDWPRALRTQLKPQPSAVNLPIHERPKVSMPNFTGLNSLVLAVYNSVKSPRAVPRGAAATLRDG